EVRVAPRRRARLQGGGEALSDRGDLVRRVVGTAARGEGGGGDKDKDGRAGGSAGMTHEGQSRGNRHTCRRAVPRGAEKACWVLSASAVLLWRWRLTPGPPPEPATGRARSPSRARRRRSSPIRPGREAGARKSGVEVT